ncbi:MAG: UvrD-helicase domain-containing protein [Holosporales bacterium]|jgi:ATP-dependent helicase/nuclease subunit A|nr:UvrD-helicase domain-containing protein [Holosporales bacterium]
MVGTELRNICDIGASVWIEASAGTGKTKALVDRILALLASGVPTQKILCITFTKAAAAEMLSRVKDKLSRWKACDDNVLRLELNELIPYSNGDQIDRCRRLFDEVLDAGSDFKVQTIHSFCQRLLEAFPMEAGLSAPIQVLDDYEASELLRSALRASIALAATNPNLIKAYEAISMFKNDASAVDLIAQLIKDRIHAELLCKKTDDEIQSGYDELFGDEADDLFVNANAALALVTKDVYGRYRCLKRDRLDYDDLIFNALILLRDVDNSWIMYKLDGGISHILVDEAQDTSPLQWEVLKALSANFFADSAKTLFVVGDHKQSIYGFQGASHQSFINARKYFKQKTIKAGLRWHDVRLNLSYRSVPQVLSFVDKIFADPQKTPGLGTLPTEHVAFRERDTGLVEFWPLIENKQDGQALPMTILLEIDATTEPDIVLARSIADKIARILKHKTFVPSKNREVTAGDFLILLQQRGALMGLIIKELQNLGLPVEGVDQFTLTDEIVTEDLIALSKFVLNPYDDFNLACLLKSPLIAMDEAVLMKLCMNRQESVYQQIERLADQTQMRDGLGNTLMLLNKWRQMASSQPPYSFFEGVLDDPIHGIRSSIIARLGSGANDVINEFMEVILKYENSNTLTIENFVPWLLKRRPRLKREFGQYNKIRVMTVHRAKGLQAPFVILADIHSQSRNDLPPAWLNTNDTYSSILPVFSPSGLKIPAKIADYFNGLKQEQEHEKQRLLYVALTRAQDHLYITGKNTSRKSVWSGLLIDFMPF